MSEQPHIFIVCDHRRDEAPVVIARYLWTDTQGVWVPAKGSRVRVEYLEGNRRGWWHADQGADEPPRTHHEIHCGTPACRVVPFRIDADGLPALFASVVVDSLRRNQFALKATASRVTLKLDKLHDARSWYRNAYKQRQ